MYLHSPEPLSVLLMLGYPTFGIAIVMDFYLIRHRQHLNWVPLHRDFIHAHRRHYLSTTSLLSANPECGCRIFLCSIPGSYYQSTRVNNHEIKSIFHSSTRFWGIFREKFGSGHGGSSKGSSGSAFLWVPASKCLLNVYSWIAHTLQNETLVCLLYYFSFLTF